MRELRFIVREQYLEKNPNCDFEGLVSGAKGYFRVRFAFSREWKDLKKVAIFRTRNVKKYVPITTPTISIPDEIVDQTTYYISVYGSSQSYDLTTNEVAIIQKRNGLNH